MTDSQKIDVLINIGYGYIGLVLLSTALLCIEQVYLSRYKLSAKIFWSFFSTSCFGFPILILWVLRDMTIVRIIQYYKRKKND